MLNNNVLNLFLMSYLKDNKPPFSKIEGNFKDKCKNEWNRKQVHNVENL